MTYNWFSPGLWWISDVLPSCQEGFNSQTLGALNKNTAAKTANTTTTSWARTLLTSNGRSFIKGSVFIAVTWENNKINRRSFLRLSRLKLTVWNSRLKLMLTATQKERRITQTIKGSHSTRCKWSDRVFCNLVNLLTYKHLTHLNFPNIS